MNVIFNTGTMGGIETGPSQDDLSLLVKQLINETLLISRDVGKGTLSFSCTLQRIPYRSSTRSWEDGNAVYDRRVTLRPYLRHPESVLCVKCFRVSEACSGYRCRQLIFWSFRDPQQAE